MLNFYFCGNHLKKYNLALLQNSPFRNPTDKKSLKNKDNFLKRSPNLPFRNSANFYFKEGGGCLWSILLR